MKTATVMTNEIDNLQEAVKELKKKLNDKLSIEKNSLGIVVCDSDSDAALLGEMLSKELSIEIVGTTSMAAIDRYLGYQDMCIMLTVLTGDDLRFSIGNTGNLEEEDYTAQINAAYSSAEEALGEKPKLVWQFAPYIPTISCEVFVKTISELSGSCPIFGGVATDHFDLEYQKTFHNGRAYNRSLIFVLFGGDIRPVFSIRHSFTSRTARRGLVSESCGGVVHQVDDKSFLDFLSGFGPVPQEKDVVFYYQSTPFVVEYPDYSEGEQPVIRVLVTLNHEEQSGELSSSIPAGTSLSMGVIEKTDLEKSCRHAVQGILEEMKKQQDYTYSLIMISTCSSRHLLIGEEKDTEARIIADELKGCPEYINAGGYYAFGEVCPTAIVEDGSARNRYHNCSFVVCAI